MVTFKDCNPNVIILTDDDNGTVDKFEGRPVLSLCSIQQCIDGLTTINNIPHAIIHSLLQIFTSQRSQELGLNLLHLITYFPGDHPGIYETLSTLLTKFPQAAAEVDCHGKTALHHAIITSKWQNGMNQECYNLLMEKSPPTVVHDAIRAGLDWNHLHSIVKGKKVDVLAMEDQETNLLPFMMAAKGTDFMEDGWLYGLSVVYEMLRMKPEVLKEYN